MEFIELTEEESLAVAQYWAKKLPNYDVGNEKKVLKAFQKLDLLQISLHILKESGIGKVVNKLRKLGGVISSRAQALVEKWKNAVAEEMDTDDRGNRRRNGGGRGADDDEEEDDESEEEEERDEEERQVDEAKSEDEVDGVVEEEDDVVEEEDGVVEEEDGVVEEKDGVVEEEEVKNEDEVERKIEDKNRKGRKARSSDGRDRKRKQSYAKDNDDTNHTEGDDDSYNKHKAVVTPTELSNAHGSFEDMLNMGQGPVKKMKRAKTSPRKPKDPLDISRDLPQLCTQYFPIPKLLEVAKKQQKPIPSKENLAKMLYSKKSRTNVYCGKKSNTDNSLPKLYDICINTLKEHRYLITYTGGIPVDILFPILEICNAHELYRIESFNNYILEDAGVDTLWKAHVLRDFKGRERGHMETWRDLYWRLHDEREAKLHSITKKVQLSIHQAQPVRHTKLAIVKAPRDVRRRQMKHTKEVHGNGAAFNHGNHAQSSGLTISSSGLGTGYSRDKTISNHDKSGTRHDRHVSSHERSRSSHDKNRSSHDKSRSSLDEAGSSPDDAGSRASPTSGTPNIREQLKQQIRELKAQTERDRHHTQKARTAPLMAKTKKMFLKSKRR